MSDTTAPTLVLLIQDEEKDFIVNCDILKSVLGVGASLECLRYNDAVRGVFFRGQFDLAIIDERLGGQAGIELIRQFRSNGGRQPVILLTDQTGREIDSAAVEAGASDCVYKKELTPTSLERSIRYSMQHARMEEQRLRLLAESTARAEAEAASRAKDQFLAVLSHELRTPLTPALMAIASIQSDPTLSQSLRDEVQMIRRSIELEARLIDDLLDLTRITRGKLELRLVDIDMHEKVRHIVRITHADAMARGVDVKFQPCTSNCHVQGDPARVQQILWNLVKNAIKFTPPGGNVSIRTFDNVPAEANGVSMLTIEIKDSGSGIEPETLPHIFDAFEQGRVAPRTFGGLGLGLTITKALVDMHGGTLRASSEGKDKGATFTLRFPLLAAAKLSAYASPAQPKSTVQTRILFVEDHIDTARAVSRVLRHRGYAVRQAGSVAAAVQAVNEEAFDLLISDIGLPDGTGFDVMRHVQKTHPIPGIAVSGYGMEADVQAAKRAGFSSHLTKPVLPDVLLTTIAKAIEPPPHA